MASPVSAPEITQLPDALEEELNANSLCTTLAFERQGLYLAAGCNDGVVHIWDLMTRSLARSFAAHVAPITDISWSRCSRRMLTSSADWSAKLWDVLSGSVLHTVRLNEPIVGSQLHPRRNVFVVCPLSAAPLLCDADAATRTALPTATGGNDEPATASVPASVARFSKKADKLYAGNRQGVLQIIDTATLVVERTIEMPAPPAIKSIVVSNSGRRLLLNSDKKLRMVSLQSHSVEREFQDAINRYQWRCCCFSNDDEYVIGGSQHKSSHKLYMWGVMGSLVKILEYETTGVVSVQFHPRRSLLASGTTGGHVLLWTATQQESWSAYAPQFRELEENVLYEEREDEFDVEDDATRAAREAEERRVAEQREQEVVDVITRRHSTLNSDSDDDSENNNNHNTDNNNGLSTAGFFLPTIPQRDEPVFDGGLAAALTGEAFAKAVEAAKIVAQEQRAQAVAVDAKRRRVGNDDELGKSEPTTVDSVKSEQ